MSLSRIPAILGLFLATVFVAQPTAVRAQRVDGGLIDPYQNGQDRASGFYPGRGGGWQTGPGPWSNYGNNNNNSTFKKLAKLGLSAGGAVVAGIVGSRFGAIGTVVGGALGFMVSHWLANKIFGDTAKDYYRSPYQNWPNQGWYSQTQDQVGIRGSSIYHQQDGNRGGGSQWSRDANRRDDNRGGGGRWSNNNRPFEAESGDLDTLRNQYYDSMRRFTQSLTGGSEEEKSQAKSEYDRAREAYYRVRINNGQ